MVVPHHQPTHKAKRDDAILPALTQEGSGLYRGFGLRERPGHAVEESLLDVNQTGECGRILFDPLALPGVCSWRASMLDKRSALFENGENE